MLLVPEMARRSLGSGAAVPIRRELRKSKCERDGSRAGEAEAPPGALGVNGDVVVIVERKERGCGTASGRGQTGTPPAGVRLRVGPARGRAVMMPHRNGMTGVGERERSHRNPSATPLNPRCVSV